jgi:serine/threonine-protein kinase
LRHAHIGAVLDVGTLDDGVPFIVLEYLEGEDLSTLEERQGRLRDIDVVDWMLEAMEGVAYAHALGYVHRDLKPSNIALDAATGSWTVKVMDFGLIKALGAEEEEGGTALTDSATILGSPAFMAPEQIDDPRNVDARREEEDLEVGLTYFDARYYAPALGGGFVPSIGDTSPPFSPSNSAGPEHVAAINHARA